MRGRDLRDHSKQRLPIPTSLDHFGMIRAGSAQAYRDSVGAMPSHAGTLRVIGSSLAALYEAATCNRMCFGGGHVLESLAGRAYNLGCSAYLLIERGFYDEALNLVRSIAEIANIVLLSAVDDAALKRWLSSDRKTRLKEFSPSKVRGLLEKAGCKDVMCADDTWYTTFCESYTHPTPKTQPNLHNDKERGVVGGVFQPNGLKLALREMANTLGGLAMLVCKFAKLDDCYAEIVSLGRRPAKREVYGERA
jgi:hypothetical protein